MTAYRLLKICTKVHPSVAKYCIKFWLKIFCYHGVNGILLRPPTRLFNEKMKKVNFLTFTAKIFAVLIAARQSGLVLQNMHGGPCDKGYFEFSISLIFLKIKIVFFKPSHGIPTIA